MPDAAELDARRARLRAAKRQARDSTQDERSQVVTRRSTDKGGSRGREANGGICGAAVVEDDPPQRTIREIRPGWWHVTEVYRAGKVDYVTTINPQPDTGETP